MNALVNTLIEWPRSVARHLDWLGPLVARIVTGWVFLWTGWGKLTHLPLVTRELRGLGHSRHRPFWRRSRRASSSSAGILLIVGLLTRISAGALGVVMIVAVATVQWPEVDSFLTLVGLEEIMYLALFLWLAIAGAGRVSIDYHLERR